jgi:hypothetical protein
MLKIDLSEIAKIDIEDILNYTFEIYGEFKNV